MNRRSPGPDAHASVRRFPKHPLTAAGLLWMGLMAARAGAQALPVSTAHDLLATHPRPFDESLETARPAPVSAEERATFGEWSPPVNAGPPLNTAYNDNYAVLSRNELTIYFTSDRPGGFGGDDLWSATRESADSPWGEPQNMGAAINTGAADSLAALSSDEHIMYFHSTRDGGCGQGDIWTTRRRNRHSDWEEPTNLGCVLNTPAVEIAPAFFEDPETEQATLFYGSNRPGGIGDFDVYASPLGEDGSVGAGMLVRELSSTGRDTRIFVRKDGLEAFVTTNRAGGQGLIDIWVSTRETPSDPWSIPMDLGSPVNSEFDDGSPWLSRHGTTLYFFSTRPGGYGKRDIWYATREKGDR
jgi:WD40-like Beta Propeller Repeat